MMLFIMKVVRMRRHTSGLYIDRTTPWLDLEEVAYSKHSFIFRWQRWSAYELHRTNCWQCYRGSTWRNRGCHSDTHPHLYLRCRRRVNYMYYNYASNVTLCKPVQLHRPAKSQDFRISGFVWGSSVFRFPKPNKICQMTIRLWTNGLLKC